MSFRDASFTRLIHLGIAGIASLLVACGEEAPPTSGGSVIDYSAMFGTANPNLITDCSATSAVLTQAVQGGGNAVKGCVRFNGAAGCANPSDFVPLASAGWVYSGQANDTWSSTVNLSNHDTYRPGTYVAYIKSSDGKVTKQYSYEIRTANTTSPNNCVPFAAAANSIADCSAATSQLTITASGAGADALGCIEYNSSTNCQTSAGFVAMSSILGAEWTYNATTNVYRFQTNTRSHPWLVPGTYRQYFRTPDGRTQTATFTVATLGSVPTSCQP